MHPLLQSAKHLVLPPGTEVRSIRTGLLRGLRFRIDTASRAQLYLGLDEREIHGWMRRLARGVRAAVDVGAAEGVYTVFFLKRTPAARVFAFEPEPRGSELEGNLEANGLLGDPRLTVRAEYVGMTSNERWLPLDSLFPHLELPCLVKVDVDGGEANVLGGAARLLAADVRWVVETHSAELEAECAAIFARAGLTTRVVPNAWWRRLLREQRTDFRGRPLAHNRWLVAYREGVPGPA